MRARVGRLLTVCGALWRLGFAETAAYRDQLKAILSEALAR